MAAIRSEIEDGIDTNLNSRQLPVYGFDAMKRMLSSDVLIVGLKGVGVEIAKNVILSGVRSVTLHDNSPVAFEDLSSQFYLSEGDVGKNTAEVAVPKLTQLNQYVTVKLSTQADPLPASFLQQFQVVVLTNNRSLEELLRVNDICHAHGTRFITADTRGLFGTVFCDFGEKFTVYDRDGEEPLNSIVANITRDNPVVVTVHDEKKHGLVDGDFVKFTEVRGATGLNYAKDHSERVFEVRVAEDVFQKLKDEAESSHQSVPNTVDRILRKELSLAE